MFTGIIESTGNILEKSDQSLTIQRPKIFDDIKEGSSINVSGVCLTVVSFDKASMTFDVIPTTLKKSKLGTLKVGDCVNLERALKADCRFDGHIVQGHCEAVAKVLDVIAKGKDRIVKIELPRQLQKYVVQHGSIAVDGVSLTVASVSDADFSIALIAHTLQFTTLGTLKVRHIVNIETDIIGRYSQSLRI